MKNIYVTCLAVAACVGSAAMMSGCGSNDAVAQAAPPFTLSSPDISSNNISTKFQLNSFGCTGQNVSPALVWANAPAGTKSFVLQLQDLDAATTSGFWHWVVYNIPGTATGLPQGAGNDQKNLPAGAYGGTSDFFDLGSTGGNGNFGGFCPPQGEAPHRYVFNLYATSLETLPLPKTATPAVYNAAMNRTLAASVLGKATYTVVFGR